MNKMDVFLAECLKRGIKHVAIGVADKRIPRSVTFGYGTQNSAFTLESKRTFGWPSIWDAARAAGVFSGCGNTAQAQVNMRELDAGYWFYRKDKGWKKG